ncbi:MAG: hypothetical protein KGQ82_12980 [Alphaproteobacteria bacterium]|nr:hypothetical protein [Alphaproteobacteria bacterium]
MNAPDGAAASEETAEKLFSALHRLCTDGKLLLRLDYKKLTHLDSPVGSEADGNIWAYGGLALVVAAWWFGGWQVAVGVAIAGVLIYFTLGRWYMHRRIRRRVEDKALADLALWRKLWKFGGVTLVSDTGEKCAAPHGNWMALVRNLGNG